MLVPSAAGFGPEVTGPDHVLEQRRRGIAALPELGVQRVQYRQAHIEADGVQELERAHWVATSELHCRVDVAGGAVALLVHSNRVVQIWKQQVIDDEPRAIAASHWPFAQAPHPRNRPL